jgi:hypothetical protein
MKANTTDNEFSPAELDGLGGNAGISTPYLPFGGNPPQQYPEYQQMNDESVMRINGQDVRATLDGVGIPFALALHLLQNGSALPAALDRYQHLQGFSFDNRGGGTFRSTWSTTSTSPGWVEKSDNNGNVTGRSWEPDGTVHTNTFEVNWSFGAALFDWEKRIRQFDKDEVSKLKTLVTELVANTKCLDFINKLLKTAEKYAPPQEKGQAPLSTQTLLESDPLKIFDIVERNGGFYFNENIGFSYSTIGGTILYGEPSSYTVEVGGKTFTRNSTVTSESQRPRVYLQTSAFYYPRSPQDPGYSKDLKKYYDGKQATLFSLSGGGLTALHELLHFNFHDAYLASAVAELNGDKKIFSLNETDSASSYWDKALKENCDPNYKPTKP